MTDEFTTRPYQPEDAQQVLGVAAQSLPRWAQTSDRAALWQWKHSGSPFGPSRILVTVHSTGVIAGVIALMPWRLRRAAETLPAARGVDLAVHPAYRGRGVANRLATETTALIRAAGPIVTFHTPNAASVGLAKRRGRQVLGTIAPSIRPRSLVRYLLRRAGRRSLAARDLASRVGDAVPIRSLLDRGGEIEEVLEGDAGAAYFRTARTLEYLRWRYADHPSESYYAVTAEERGRLAASVILRVSAGETATGVIIQEILFKHRDPRIAAELRRRLLALRDMDFILGSVAHDPLEQSVLGRFGVLRARRLGYTLAVGALHPRFAEAARQYSAWGLTMGDLDGF